MRIQHWGTYEQIDGLIVLGGYALLLAGAIKVSGLRQIQVGALDRQIAECEAVRRALNSGARRARVLTAAWVVDDEGRPVWNIELFVLPRRR